MENRNASRIGIPITTYKAAVKDEKWLYGVNNVLTKVSDEMVEVTCTKDLIETQNEFMITVMGMFNIKVVSSGCPLIKGIEAVESETPEDAVEALKTYQTTYRSKGVFR